MTFYLETPESGHILVWTKISGLPCNLEAWSMTSNQVQSVMHSVLFYSQPNTGTTYVEAARDHLLQFGILFGLWVWFVLSKWQPKLSTSNGRRLLMLVGGELALLAELTQTQGGVTWGRLGGSGQERCRVWGNFVIKQLQFWVYAHVSCVSWFIVFSFYLM